MSNQFGHATQSRDAYGRHVLLNRNPRLSRLFEPDGWTWCLSNPDTYRMLAEMRAELDVCRKRFLQDNERMSAHIEKLQLQSENVAALTSALKLENETIMKELQLS